MTFQILPVDPNAIENPYCTFVALNKGASKTEIAYAYFADFLDLLGTIDSQSGALLVKAEIRYRELVDMFYDDFDVTLEELRGFVDGVATLLDFPESNREWLHDAFEWVRK